MNEQWARDWCDAMSSGDTARALGFYADDVTFDDVTFGFTAEGEGFLPVMEHFVGSGNNAFRFVRFTGDTSGGAVESMWQATHPGEFLGVEGAGRSTEVRLVTILAFDEQGRITRHCDYWDARSVLAQLD